MSQPWVDILPLNFVLEHYKGSAGLTGDFVLMDSVQIPNYYQSTYLVGSTPILWSTLQKKIRIITFCVNFLEKIVFM